MLGAVAAGMPWTVSSLVRRGNYPILLISSIGTNNSRAQASAVGSSIRDVSGTLVLLQTPLHLSVLAPRVVARVDSGVLTQLLVEVRCNIAGIDATSAAGHHVTLNATENPPLDEPWLRFEQDHGAKEARERRLQLGNVDDILRLEGVDMGRKTDAVDEH